MELQIVKHDNWLHPFDMSDADHTKDMPALPHR